MTMKSQTPTRMALKTAAFCRLAIIVSTFLLVLTSAHPPAAQAMSGEGAAPPVAPQKPLGEMLNPNGTLNLATGDSGDVAPRGWRTVSEPQEAPRFMPLAGDENWSSDFMNGIGSRVNAL